MKRAPCGLDGRLPDAHVTAAVFSGAAVDMPEVLLRTRAEATAGGEHNRDKKGIALIVLNNSGDSGASAPFALTCAEDSQKLEKKIALINKSKGVLKSEVAS